MIQSQTVNIPQTISGGVGGPSGGGQGGSGGTGEGPRMNYDINAEHFTMPVHFLMPDYRLEDSRVGLSGTTSEGPSSMASVPSSARPFPFTPQFNFYGTRKRRREDIINSDESPTQTSKKRRQMEEKDGIQIIAIKNLKLIHEIGPGSGYFLHAGQYEDRAVVVKVFNPGPTGRQLLKSTTALSMGFMHSNLLRMIGISSSTSLIHFIAYEDVHWKNAEGPLAVALKNDLSRSIRLGFEMMAGLSAGMNFYCVQGVFLKSMGVDNFDVFLDLNDRFIISINPPQTEEVNIAGDRELEDDAWTVFIALCQKILMSANRVLHHEQIERDPEIPDALRPISDPIEPSPVSFESGPFQTLQEEEELAVSPRREYVWRTMDRGQQSLATVSRRLALELAMNLWPIYRSTQSDGRNPHRCPGYVREEIKLATTALDSAVVAHDTPSPLEICSVCHEAVGFDERFRCICGDITPGSNHTIKCRECKLWSHSYCFGHPKTQFTCPFCVGQNQTQQDNHPSLLGFPEPPIPPLEKGRFESPIQPQPGIARPSREHLQAAMAHIAKLKSDYSPDKLLATIPTIDVPAEQRMEYNIVLEQLHGACMDLDHNLPILFAVLKKEDLVQMLVIIAHAAIQQRAMISSGSTRFLASLETLRTMLQRVVLAKNMIRKIKI